MVNVIVLPNGNRVSLGAYVRAWRTLKLSDPRSEFKGWEWYPMPAGQILERISYGVQDRIRGGVVVRELSEKRLIKLREKHRSAA